MTPEQLQVALTDQLDDANRDVEASVDGDYDLLQVRVDVRDQIQSDLEVVDDYLKLKSRLKTF